ncbi:MAG: hypothetical protein KQJ78_21500 [Deltaproteobacteria bacterium]|nr:hypothetical protein [Deltaproteobacteria bacterium]
MNGLKNLFGVVAILLSFWTAMLTGFLIGPRVFLIMYGEGYRPAVFTITKLNFFKGSHAGSQANRTYDKHWADGTVDGNQETYKLGGYLRGPVNRLEDLESQFKVGQRLSILYNPEVPRHLELRVQYPEENFRASWEATQRQMVRTAYLPLLAAMGLCLLCGLLAGRLKSAAGFCLGSLLFVAFAWFPTLVELWFP